MGFFGKIFEKIENYGNGLKDLPISNSPVILIVKQLPKPNNEEEYIQKILKSAGIIQTGRISTFYTKSGNLSNINDQMTIAAEFGRRNKISIDIGKINRRVIEDAFYGKVLILDIVPYILPVIDKTTTSSETTLKNTGFFNRVVGTQSPLEAQPTFQKKYTTANGSIYEIYNGNSPANAQAFLKTKKVEKQYYYIMVETPDGNWGLDKEGLFLEHLEPWQISLINNADCQGRLLGLSWSSFGLEMAARGLNDNFVCDIECGKCKQRWTDGIRYQNTTVVRCPGCRAFNRVDSGNVEIAFIGK